MDPKMQAAYQEFMLKGKKKNPTNSGGGVSTPSPSSTRIGPPHSASPSSSQKNYYANNQRSTPRSSTTNKGIRPVFKAFQGRLQDWKDSNEQSEQVLGSIRNLRDRIVWETDHLGRIKEASLSNDLAWEGWGFRDPSSNNALLEEDVELALHHDLLQHERMLAALRSLISSMAQAIDSMGRRLDEWLVATLQYDDCGDGAVASGSASILEMAKQVYSFLSEELYRKQVLVQDVLDSCHEGLVDQDWTEGSWRGNPRQVVRNACKEWTSNDKEAQSIVDRLLSTP